MYELGTSDLQTTLHFFLKLTLSLCYITYFHLLYITITFHLNDKTNSIRVSTSVFKNLLYLFCCPVTMKLI